MVDSISVIGPGWRATDNSGNLIADGILAFFDAGTSNARTVYSDSGLSVSLGTSVSCNSAGYPVTSGNVKTLIYTGDTPYKIRLTSVLFGGTVWEHDNVKGALDTASFLTSAAVADQTPVTTSTNRAVTTADKGKIIDGVCTGGTITLTFADAATLGSGFFVGIRHAGTANQVRIIGDGTDTFAIPGGSVTSFALTGLGQSLWVTCDSTNFKTHSWTPPLIQGGIGVIAIADRLSTPPGSPPAGARYILTSSPTGAWSSFAEHDIAEADGGGGWFRYTPVADCGWIAYVQDEDCFYSFAGSAWRAGAVNVGGLTEDTNPDTTSDFVPTYDASAATGKKVKPYYLPGALIAIIEDQKAQNTPGGTFTSGADQTRTLNTLVFNRDSIVSLASNQFTLPAGVWDIEWNAPAFAVSSRHQSMLYSVTAAAVVQRGRSASASADYGESVGSTRVSIGSSTTYEIRHRCQTTNADEGFGVQANFGTEVYTRVVIRRG